MSGFVFYKHEHTFAAHLDGKGCFVTIPEYDNLSLSSLI